jgi:hypothetical protein
MRARGLAAKILTSAQSPSHEGLGLAWRSVEDEFLEKWVVVRIAGPASETQNHIWHHLPFGVTMNPAKSNAASSLWKSQHSLPRAACGEFMQSTGQQTWNPTQCDRLAHADDSNWPPIPFRLVGSSTTVQRVCDWSEDARWLVTQNLVLLEMWLGCVYHTLKRSWILGGVRVARELAVRGDLKRSETLWGEAFIVHQDMLWQYESTLGNFCWRSCDSQPPKYI